MGKNLPHLSGIRQWIYTAYSSHYTYECVVKATTIQEARSKGSKIARQVFGGHAVLRRDEIREIASPS